MSAVCLASGPGLAVHSVTCHDDHTAWSPPEPHDDYRVVLVRRGRFRRRVAGRTADLDPTVGYLGVAGEEDHFAHPAGGDVCTSMTMSPAVWRSLTTGAAPTRRTVYVDARLDLAHRRLLRATGGDDVDYAVVERLLALLGTALRDTATAEGVEVRSDRALVARAREAIRAGDPGGLLPLADLLDVSPFRLSRAFSRQLGVSLTHYRNRVRVERVLDRLEGGERDLAALAADLGFADQSHLCRTMRRHLDHPPSTVRRLLARSGG